MVGAASDATFYNAARPNLTDITESKSLSDGGRAYYGNHRYAGSGFVVVKPDGQGVAVVYDRNAKAMYDNTN